MERYERRKGQGKEGGWDVFKMAPFLPSLTYKWNSAVEKKSVLLIEEEREGEDGEGKGWRSGKVNPHAVPSDASVALFRATVGLNGSIKVFGYQIPTLIDFPKPSASGRENLKEMRLSTEETNKELKKDCWRESKSRRFWLASRPVVVIFEGFYDARSKG